MSSYGGFWVRFVAYLIDAIILQIAAGFLVGVILALVAGIGDGAGALANSARLLTYAVSFPGNWLYFGILESSSWQGTVGKKALKLIVTDEHGERIGFGRATGRYFAKIISSMILLFGFFMIGWTERKRGLHDMIAGTLVYRAASPELVRNSARIFE